MWEVLNGIYYAVQNLKTAVKNLYIKTDREIFYYTLKKEFPGFME